MPYSLLSATSVGFDLARREGGAAVAEALLQALRCDPATLDVVARHHPGAGRAVARAALTDAEALEQVGTPSALAGTAVQLAQEEQLEASRRVLAALATGPLADLAALDLLLGREVLDWTWTPGDAGLELAVRSEEWAPVADVLADALAAAWSAPSLPAAARRRLGAPFVAALHDLSPAVHDRDERAAADPDGLPSAAVRVLAQVSAWSPGDRAAWRAAVDPLRRGERGWSTAMHEASWAAHLSGRVRLAAAGQLRAVQAFWAAGLDPDDGAAGSWNALSGVVQAAVVADLLPTEPLDVLQRPWVVAFATAPPAA
ncbi:hypothetical protein [Angustibacter aerolatus]